MVRSFTLCCFSKWLIPQYVANSITSRIQTMNVCSFLVPHHFRTTRSARMEQSIGMNGHRTDKSHTRVARGVLIGLIMAHPIVVLDSALKGSGSGSSSYYCRLDSRGWWLTITSVGVDWQEGAFFFFFIVRYSRSNLFLHQNDSTTRRSQQTSLRRRYWDYCYFGFSSLVHRRDYWNCLSVGRI